MEKPITNPRHLRFLLPFVLLSACVLGTGLFTSKKAKPAASRTPNYSSNALCGSGPRFDLSKYDSSKVTAPLFPNMGNYHYEVKTASELASRYFDQGLKLVYGFNHGEAHRAFSEAIRLDSNFVMAYWGQAIALGPNINDPKPEIEREQLAFESIQKAMKLRHLTNQKERDFVEALATRYADTTYVNRDSLNFLYATAMQQLAKRYPNDNEALTFSVDALMNTTPWDYYKKDGTPRTGIEAGVKTLEKVIATNWNHPGAHHLYIHIVEASKTPERAVPSADVLGSLIPASGHLVHMPSHIYIRVGRYADAMDCNRSAIEKDEDYLAQCQAQGAYPLAYYPHNIHFLWTAATFEGKSKIAIDAAEKTARRSPSEMAGQLDFLQPYLAAPFEAYVRFGKWNDILTTPAPPQDQKLVRMVWHYARGVSFVRKGWFDKAETELVTLDTSLSSFLKALKEKLVGDKKGKPLSKMDSAQLALVLNLSIITSSVVKGELYAATRNYPAAINALEQAVAAEDELAYNEPANWHQPVRQVLGAVLLEAGQAQKAEKAYREDLAWNRNNGWSQFGLYQSLKAQGRDAEAKAALAKYKEVWVEADVELKSSRF